MRGTVTPIPVQNISRYTDQTLPKDYVWVYHTHGFRNYIGKNKMHARPDCPHLLRWQPEGAKRGSKYALEKILMKDCYPKDLIWNGCKTCWEKK